MSEAYKRTFRALMIDQHFPDAPFITFDRFSAEKQIQKCLDAKVDSLHITTKCIWGFSYYPTKIGTPHPAMKKDIVGELVSACKGAGIEAIAYYPIVFDNVAFLNHPEWRLRDGRRGEKRWGVVCANTGYRKYILGQLDEITRDYDFDGIFLDGFWIHYSPNKLCKCDDCMRLFEQRYGKEFSSQREREYLRVKFAQERQLDLVRSVKETARKRREGISLSLNPHTPFQETSSILKEIDWLYTEGGENPHHAVMLRGAGKKYYQLGVTGPSMQDVFSLSLTRLQTSTILAHGGRVFFYFKDGRNPDGTFDKEKYNFLKKINTEIAKKEVFVKDVSPYKWVGIVYDPASLPDLLQRTYEDYAKRVSSCINSFRRINVPCEIIPKDKIEAKTLNDFKLIVFPNIKNLPEEKVKYLEDYVRGGGNILATCESGLYNLRGEKRKGSSLQDLLGIEYEGMCTKYQNNRVGSYLRFDDHPIFSHVPRISIALPGNFIMSKLTSARALAWHILPLDVETKTNYIGWEPLPPGKKTSSPAVTMSCKGGGKAIFCSPPIFQYLADGVRWPANFIKGLIETLTGYPDILMLGPESVEMTCFYQGEGRIIIHLLSRLKEDDKVYPIGEVRVKVKKNFFPLSKARLVWPEEKNLNIGEEDKFFSILSPEIKIHNIILLER